MGCPICDNKPANCDCTATEREQFDEIESLRAEIARLREERRSISTLLQKVESLEADNAKLRDDRLTNEEREAIQLALTLEWPHTSEQWEAMAGCVGPVCKVPANKYKVAIDAFLGRQPKPPGPETKEVRRE
jgi:chromosome segregation ATPase